MSVIALPASMVERKVLRSNVLRFLAALIGVMIGPFPMAKDAKGIHCPKGNYAIGDSVRQRTARFVTVPKTEGQRVTSCSEKWKSGPEAFHTERRYGAFATCFYAVTALALRRVMSASACSQSPSSAFLATPRLRRRNFLASSFPIESHSFRVAFVPIIVIVVVLFFVFFFVFRFFPQKKVGI